MHCDASVATNTLLEIPRRQGASEALERTFATGLPVLYRQAYQLLGNRADAEDAVQDALLAAYTHLDQFKGQSKMSTWVGAIVLNSARLQLRRRLRHIHVSFDEPIREVQILSLSERLPDVRPNAEDEYRNAELNARLTRLHRRLSPILRRTFQLRAIEGLTIRETAQILGLPQGTVKAQFARARKTLKEWMRREARWRSHHQPARWADL